MGELPKEPPPFHLQQRQRDPVGQRIAKPCVAGDWHFLAWRIHLSFLQGHYDRRPQQFEEAHDRRKQPWLSIPSADARDVAVLKSGYGLANIRMPPFER